MVGSFPIEMAWVGEDGVGEAHLIVPEDDWHEWSHASESIHGISRQQLAAEGQPAHHVAARYLAAASGADALYFDGRSVDQGWSDTLVEAAGERRLVRLSDVADLYAEACRPLLRLLPDPDHRLYKHARNKLILDARQLLADVQAAEHARVRRRHRALDDARGLLWTWMELLRRVADLTGDPPP